jgi:hypothetical protein
MGLFDGHSYGNFAWAGTFAFGLSLPEPRLPKAIIDETPMAYKSIDAVMEAQRDLVDVVHTGPSVFDASALEQASYRTYATTSRARLRPLYCLSLRADGAGHAPWRVRLALLALRV